jgi:hypothetical protein
MLDEHDRMIVREFIRVLVRTHRQRQSMPK